MKENEFKIKDVTQDLIRVIDDGITYLGIYSFTSSEFEFVLCFSYFNHKYLLFDMGNKKKEPLEKFIQVCPQKNSSKFIHHIDANSGQDLYEYCVNILPNSLINLLNMTPMSQ